MRTPPRAAASSGTTPDAGGGGVTTGSVNGTGAGAGAITGGGSIYPFCWNLLLAARSRGLGGVMTTFLARAEPQAAPLLDLPANYAIASMIFIGHPVHQPTKLKRAAVESFTTVDGFDGTVFTG